MTSAEKRTRWPSDDEPVALCGVEFSWNGAQTKCLEIMNPYGPGSFHCHVCGLVKEKEHIHSADAVRKLDRLTNTISPKSCRCCL